MDDPVQPGIKFIGVDLIYLQFAIRGQLPKEIPTGIGFSVRRRLSEDEKDLDILLETDVFGDVKDEDRPPIDLKFALRGRYTADENTNMSMEEFAKHNAPAHLIPYAREVIANTTSRSLLPTLNLGPINVIDMIENGTAEFIIEKKPKEQEGV